MEIPNKKYKLIYADPAWKYDDEKGNDPALGGITYPTMTNQELCNLPIRNIADEDCALLMWVTMPKLEECFQIIKAWGFKYITCAFVWIKKNKGGNGIYSGLGHWVNGNAELCLFAKKGTPKRINKDIKQIILSPLREHSRKPDETYVRIERLFGDIPRIELFARNRREGWDVWGNEAPTDTQNMLHSLDTKHEGDGGTNFTKSSADDFPYQESLIRVKRENSAEFSPNLNPTDLNSRGKSSADFQHEPLRVF